MQSSGKGDVELSVTLDTSGLKKETEKIKAEIEKGVATSNTEIKPQTDVKPIQIIVQQAKQASTALQQTTATANSVVKEMEEAGNKVPTEEFAVLSQNAAWLEKELEKTNAQLDHMELINEDATPKFSKMAEKALELENALAKAKDQMQAMIDLGEAFQVVNVEQDDLAQREAELARLQAILDKNKEAASEFASEMKNVATASEEVVTSFNYENPLEKTKLPDQFTDEIENAQEVIEQTQEEAVKEFEGDYARFIEYIQAAEEKAREMAETLEGLRDVGADPDDIAEMESEYDTLIEKISLMRNNIKMGSTAWKEMTPNERFTQFIYKVKNGLQEMGKAIQDKAVPALKQFGSRLAGIVRSGVQNGIKKLSTAFKKLIPSINSSNKGFSQGIKSILKYVLGISSLFVLFNKLRTALTEGLRNLAQWKDGNNEVNENLSIFISSLLQLKNQLAAAFAPIVNIVVPILNTFIYSLIEAMNYLSQFIAKLTGQDVWIKATKVQKNYAASLDKTGKAAKDATGKLAGFDDLDVLSQKDTSGAGGIDPNDMFEEMPIEQVEDSVLDWIDKLKVAWENGDFTEFGEGVGEWLKNALESIPWGDIQDTAKKLAHSLATFLNGFFETEGLGAQIGATIAEALNTAFIAVNEFVHTLHWTSIGEFIAEGLLSFLDTLKFDEAGQALGGALRGMIDLAFSTVSTFTENGGWKKLSDGIITFVNNFINELNEINPETGLSGWEEAGVTLYDLAYGFISSLGDTIEGLPWKDFGNGIAQFLSQIDFTSLAAELLDCANSLIDGIAEAIKQLQPIQLAGLAAAIASVIAGLSIGVNSVHLVILGATATIGFNVGKVIGEALFPDDAVFYETFEWSDIFGSPEDAINGLKLWAQDIVDGLPVVFDIIALPFTGIAPLLLEGFLNGLIGFDIETPFKDFFSGLILWVKDIFGIHSPSTVFKEIGENVIQGFIDGVQAMIESLMGIWDRIKALIFEKVTAMKDTVMTKIDSFKLTFLGAFVEIQSKFISIWNKIKDGLKSPINAIIGMVEGLVNKVIDGINGLTSKLNSLTNLKFKNPFNGETSSFDLPKIGELQHISIPRLAQGAVIPPNREFMAMLGDQTSGTNIEAPLDTITEAFADVVGSMRNTGNAVMQLDGQTFARLVVPYVMGELDRRGYNVKVLEG